MSKTQRKAILPVLQHVRAQMVQDTMQDAPFHTGFLLRIDVGASTNIRKNYE